MRAGRWWRLFGRRPTSWTYTSRPTEYCTSWRTDGGGGLPPRPRHRPLRARLVPRGGVRRVPAFEDIEGVPIAPLVDGLVVYVLRWVSRVSQQHPGVVVHPRRLLRDLLVGTYDLHGSHRVVVHERAGVRKK